VTPANVFTIDVEDWYHLKIDEPHTWGGFERRTHVGTDILLEMLARRGIRATCFVLAHVAETTPDLVRRIAAAGHEIASHGYNHQLVYRQTEAQFEEDLRRSIGLLEPLAGAPIRGYRASSFSVSPKTPWFWDVLARNGIAWDSSVFPVKNPLYGGVDAPPEPHRRGRDGARSGVAGAAGVAGRVPGHDILEIPIAPVSVGGLAVPFAGGFYFRFHSTAFLRWAANRVNRAGRPVIYYVHPWEYDLEQPRMALPPHWRFFRYHRLGAMARATEAVLDTGAFETMGALAARHEASPTG
jgi:polysaccharide deacetylase family protein (PEP-CTERM system associated)